MKSIVSEHELLEFCRCPLRVSGPPVPKHEFGSRLNTAIAELVQQAFNSSSPTKPQIIHKLDTVREFNRLQDKKPKNPVDGAAYKARMTVADSLAGIFRSYRVLQPVTKYRMKVGRIQIDGDYAILRDSITQDPLVLQLRSDNLVVVPGTTGDQTPPNIISYIRHWHLLTAHGYRDGSILNLHVPSGKVWIQWVPIYHSEKFVKSAVEAYQSKFVFPVPGVHCSTCVSQACLNEAVV